MDAKKAIEEGRSYLLVMTDRRMKPDEADAKKMQKIEKFIEKTERKKLPSPNKRRESGSSEGVQEQVPKNTIRTRASIPGDSSSGVPQRIKESQGSN